MDTRSFKILHYAKELKWKLSMALDKIAELQSNQISDNTSGEKRYQWYRVIGGRIIEWTDAKYTEAEMNLFPYCLQRWYKAEQTAETISESEEPNASFEQELDEKLLYQIDCPAVATHKEVVDRIKKKFAFDNLSDDRPELINNTLLTSIGKRELSDIEKIRESLKRVETDPEFAKKVLIESGIYDEDMKLTPAYKYDGLEREKHEEAVLIIKEIKKRYTVGDYWIPNISSETKTTLILYNTNIEDNTTFCSEMKEMLDNSRFFDNIFSDRSPIQKYKDMI